MSRIKSLLALYGAMALSSEFDLHNPEYKLTEEKKEQLKAIAEQKKIERLKNKGLKEYFYGENVIYAINKKNADRKAKRKGYL